MKCLVIAGFAPLVGKFGARHRSGEILDADGVGSRALFVVKIEIIEGVEPVVGVPHGVEAVIDPLSAGAELKIADLVIELSAVYDGVEYQIFAVGPVGFQRQHAVVVEHTLGAVAQYRHGTRTVPQAVSHLHPDDIKAGGLQHLSIHPLYRE